MRTPDGKEFTAKDASKSLDAVLHALGAAGMLLLRALGKLIITIWRLAAALDSALWRALKLLARKAVRGLAYAGLLAGAALRNLVLWLPTRMGRAYSAIFGVFMVIASLWLIDRLRMTPAISTASSSILRPPIDEDDPILARIEGRYVHLSEIEAAARAGSFLRPGEKLTPKTAFERELVESYVEQRLLAGAALDDGLQRVPSISRRVNAARDRVLASAFMERRIKDAVTPSTIKRLYERQAGVTKLGDEVRARHILVKTKEEAEEVMTLLKGGADFGALAQERSIDRATAPLGGEVGWFARAMMTPAFSKAAFSVKPGELAGPFQTEFGWHILEVTGRRPTGSAPLSKVRGGIEDFLRMRTIETTLSDLEEQNQVVYFRPDEEQKTISPAPPDLSAPEIIESDGAGDEDTLR